MLNVRSREIHKFLSAFFVLSLVLLISTSAVHAQIVPIEAEIHPSQGTASTQILIRFLTTNETVGNVTTADFFWDDATVGLNLQGNLSADGSYNYFLGVPSEPPLSNVGNHSIRADSFVMNYGQVSFNFTFEITEFVPSTEYIALNETYYALLSNYTTLLDSYNTLLTNYSTLLVDHNTLLTEHTDLLSNYNSLSANYNSLLANFNALSANFNSLLSNNNNLNSLYNSFLGNYTNLQTNYTSLISSYDNLTANYFRLESDYEDLKANYDAFVGELALTRNLNYVLIASTIVLAVATLYLLLRKPKIISRTR
jgi:hypothetical protein